MTTAAQDPTKDFVIDTSGYITNYVSTAAEVIIPSTVKDKDGVTRTVYGINATAFAGKTYITNVVMNQVSTLTYLAPGCFEGCTGLKSVSLPNNLTDLGKDVFKGCTNLTTITWSNILDYIGTSAFEGCTALTVVSLPENVTVIDDAAFKGCTGLTTLQMQEGMLYSIGKEAFSGCTNLKSIYIPNSVSNLGSSAFAGCTAATVLSLPTSIDEIYNFTFQGCTGLTSVSIPAGVKNIDRRAFYGCSGIVKVTIPNGVELVDEEAFAGLSSECAFVFENNSPRNPDIRTNAFGNAKIMIAYADSTVHTYAKNHSGFTFYSWAIGDFVTQAYKELHLKTVTNGTNHGTWYTNLLALGSGSLTAGDFIGALMADKAYTNRNLGDSDAALSAVYKAMLGRDYDSTGSKALTKMENGVTIRYIANEICESKEFRDDCAKAYGGIIPGNVPTFEERDINYNRTAFVARAYVYLLGRKFDVDGLNYWVYRLRSGELTGQSLIWGFVHSPEYVNLHLSHTEAVERMYLTMLNRHSEPGGADGWIKLMDSGASIDQIIGGFVGAPEYQNLCKTYGIIPGDGGAVVLPSSSGTGGVKGFVERCYKQALGRNGEPSGITYWMNILNNKERTPAEVAYGFVFSIECVNKNLSNIEFTRMLYRLYLGREAEAGGAEYWAAMLNNGQTRTNLVNSFASSQEFTNIVTSYGLSN